jgi:hypothetical protein
MERLHHPRSPPFPHPQRECPGGGGGVEGESAVCESFQTLVVHWVGLVGIPWKGLGRRKVGPVK